MKKLSPGVLRKMRVALGLIEAVCYVKSSLC